jgi:hypothetical protein
VSAERSAVRGYRVLLRLYPRRFREEYGPDMVLLMSEQCRDEPLARVVGRAALDLAITIPNQHLEARMHRAPMFQTPFVYLAIAVAGLALAILGGSAPAAPIIGLGVAAAAGSVAVIAWRRAAPATDRAFTAGWWKFLLFGPALIASVIVAAGLGVEAWFLGVFVVLVAIASIALGVTLGVAHALGARGHQTTA